MRRTIFFVFFISFVVSNLFAQNWDINTLHRVNGWDNKFVRNYNKFISRSEPYVAIGVPVAMALTAWAKKDKDLLKDAVYVGTSVAGAFVVTYGMKYLVDRERPYDRYPDRVHPYSHESSPSFPSGHTASAFALATSLCIKYPKWYVIAPSALWACSVGVSRMNEGVLSDERSVDYHHLSFGCTGRCGYRCRLCDCEYLCKPLAEPLVVWKVIRL